MENLVGQQFGKLTVVSYSQRINGCHIWECVCDCGNTSFVRSYNLKNGTTKSCGCLRKATLLNLVGRRFGMLVVLSRADYIHKNKPRWLCNCDCGKEVIRVQSSLINGDTISCGCSRYNRTDLIGQRFGRLVVQSFSHMDKYYNSHWVCKCDCGNIHISNKAVLSRGEAKSCGCLNREIVSKITTKHNLSHTKLYAIWSAMKDRCLNPLNRAYKHYGGRGIKICDPWAASVENFYRDMGHPTEGMSLDRIDNNGNYCPENCRWIAQKEQNANKRDNILITIDGVTKCLSHWCEYFHIPVSTARYRLVVAKWEIDKVFSINDAQKELLCN